MKKTAKTLLAGAIILAAGISGTAISASAVAGAVHPTPEDHQYKVNESGETYGIAAGNPVDPDLIAAVGDNGKSGYVRSSDLIGPEPKSPAEAASETAKLMVGGVHTKKILLYAADGKKVLGTFTVTTEVGEPPQE
ncbi:hypothetical protein [Agromyces sp. NPDC049794]|uniref:hypothetical protein n=1 Tax=unclassified Agromyces TaxID=2639701 RepID=UPI0033CE3BEF